MNLPLLLATADIHSPEYLQKFLESLKKVGDRPCLFLFAGDIIDRGNVAAAEPVFRAVEELGARPVATFGNDEYQEVWDEMKSRYRNVDWLVDNIGSYTCDGVKVAVVGTPGSLDLPTSWQRRHMPGIEEVYRKRVETVAQLLREAKESNDVVILLSHYALAKANLKGEDPRAYPMLYSSRMERVVAELRPTMAVHGHAHRGSRFTLVNGVPVYNVAFPLTWAPVWLRHVSAGLEAFLR